MMVMILIMVMDDGINNGDGVTSHCIHVRIYKHETHERVMRVLKESVRNRRRDYGCSGCVADRLFFGSRSSYFASWFFLHIHRIQTCPTSAKVNLSSNISGHSHAFPNVYARTFLRMQLLRLLCFFVGSNVVHFYDKCTLSFPAHPFLPYSASKQNQKPTKLKPARNSFFRSTPSHVHHARTHTDTHPHTPTRR